MSRYAIFLICVVSVIGMTTNAARILAVFPYPSHSHQIVFRALTKELWKRGHDLVIFTTEPTNDTGPTNYTQIDLSEQSYIIKSHLNVYEESQRDMYEVMSFVRSLIYVLLEKTLSNPYMQRLIHPSSTEKFDVVLVQTAFTEPLHALSLRFNAPSIAITSLPPITHNNYVMGNLMMPSYSPDVFGGLTDQMTIWERMLNFYHITRQILEFVYIIEPQQDKLMRTYFGDDMPYIGDISRNISIFLFYANPYFMYPHPNVPSLIFFGGSHLSRQNKTIPSDLKKFLDESKQGVIYFSLGSNIKSAHLPKEKHHLFCSTLAELPYKVLWKFEDDSLANKSSNIIIRKWLPQQEILAHPNIVLFMFQGGIQSTHEAINNALPIIGFPFFSDQRYNVRRLQYLGVAKEIDIHSIDKETLKRAIIEMVSNPRYKENAIKLRDLFQDLPYDPMQNAVWWIEHVIRHKGASHLRNVSRDIPFYQLVCLDIIAIFTIALLLLFYVLIVAMKWMIKLGRFICRRPQKNVKTD